MQQLLHRPSLAEQQKSTGKPQGNSSSNSLVKRIIGKTVIGCSGQGMNAPRADYLLPLCQAHFAGRAILWVNKRHKVADNIGKA